MNTDLIFDLKVAQARVSRPFFSSPFHASVNDRRKIIFVALIFLASLWLDENRSIFAGETKRFEKPTNDFQQQVGDVERHLGFLYSFYFVVKGCNEVSVFLGNEDFKSTVATSVAERILKDADKAAKEVGANIDDAWRRSAPMGRMAEADLKISRPQNAQICARSGDMFTTIVSWLQMSLNRLGSKANLLPRDY